MQHKRKHPDINLNLNVRGLSQSATVAINEKSNELIAEGRKVFKLGLGQSPFPVPDRVVRALKKNAPQKAYLPVQGLGMLRESIADFNSRLHGIESKAKDILIGPGSKELIFILQLVYYGDLVIPAPGWVSYSPQARIIGRNVHWIPTYQENQWRMTAAQLEMLCRTDPSRPRVLILNYPANPTGCTYQPQELEAIAEVARKYKVILISDEIYGLLHFKGKHVSIAHFYEEGTIISSGLSKWCGAGGWRLGTFSFPSSLRWLRDAMSIVASETFTSTSAPIQYAAVEAFKSGEDIDEYLYHSRRILEKLGGYLTARLRAMKATVCDPEGAFYVFPNFEYYRESLKAREIYTGVELCNAILEDTGVAMLPGYNFGCQPEDLTARIAFVDFNGSEALRASKRDYAEKPIDDAFLTANCPGILEAIDRLEQWLGKL